MTCEICREALSAGLDGEEPGLDSDMVAAHLSACGSCRSFAVGLSELNRTVRIRPAAGVPDLSERILARVDTPRRFRPEWARYALFVVALTQLVIALPAMITGSDAGTAVHLARELGSWDVALAIGLLYAAWKPERASGLLPFALALAAAQMLTSTLDVAAGHTTWLSESPHLFSLIGVTLLAVLSSASWWTVPRTTPAPAR